MAAEARSVDAKAHFANERTFLRWLSVTVTLGGLASGLLGVSGHVHKKWDTGFRTWSAAIRLLALFALGLSIVLTVTAARKFQHRREMLSRKVDGPYSSLMLPLAYGLILLIVILFAFSGAVFGLIWSP